jgi:hypothetical protein
MRNGKNFEDQIRRIIKHFSTSQLVLLHTPSFPQSGCTLMAISLHFGEPFLLKAGKELSRKPIISLTCSFIDKYI